MKYGVTKLEQKNKNQTSYIVESTIYPNTYFVLRENNLEFMVNKNNYLTTTKGTVLRDYEKKHFKKVFSND